MKLKALSTKLFITSIATFGLVNSVLAADEVFESSLILTVPLSIVETSPLTFPATVAGADASVVVAAADAGAAVFEVHGAANAPFTATITEASINMLTGDGVGTTKQIPVASWVFGGDLTDGGGSGTATLPAGGSLTDARVGATATVAAEDIAGTYAADATFQVVYQ